MFLDMDNFKYVNDTFGHQAGDELLKIMANVLTTKLRSTDISARFGGDEFVTLLPETRKEDAGKVAEKILKTFDDKLNTFLEKYNSQLAVDIPSSKKPSISIGIAECGENAELSPEDLLQKADKALYLAKVSGKGRIAFYDDML